MFATLSPRPRPRVLATARTSIARPPTGPARTREQVRGAVADRFAQDVSASRETVGGVPTVVVRVRAVVPPLGLWGPGVDLSVTGHGVQETAP